MFTLEQLKQAHSQVKSGADFPSYIQAIKLLGVISYETFVSDGHTNYCGANDFKITSPAKYESLVVADSSDAAQFIIDLKAHQQGKTDFPTFCRDSAKCGIEKWVSDLQKMTCTYYDKAGNELLVEMIPQ